MAFEVEQKFLAPDHDALARRLEAMGARAGPAVEIEDLYFNHPARDFAATDEALRLRRAGDQNVVTYKGPKRAGPTKTREEVEVPIAPGDAASGDIQYLLIQLGFIPVGGVLKTRKTYQLAGRAGPMTVSLDDAGDLGRFVEIETLAAVESDLPDAQAAVAGLAEDLGLVDLEPRSYLRMSLERSSGGLVP